jgi:SEC-C motif
MIPTPDLSPDPTLTPQQHRVINLLAEGNSITQAAAAENIHRNTIGYWRRTCPAFARELEFALREQRLYWHEQATRLAPQAIQTIFETLTNPESSPSLRFRAATLILKMAADPESRALKAFPTLPAELEAQTGQTLGWRKEKIVRSIEEIAKAEQNCTTPGPETSENPESLQTVQIPHTAQNCTNPQPIRVAPKPGRNSSCPCGSKLKFKRCCANKPPTAGYDPLPKSA